MTNHAGTSRDNVRIFLTLLKRARRDDTLNASRGLISRGRIPSLLFTLVSCSSLPPLVSCRAMMMRVWRVCCRDGSRWSD